MVRTLPGRDGVARGHLSPGSAVARAVGEDPREPGAGGQGVPRQPGNPRGARPCPRTHGVLAEMVLSLQPAQPEPRRPGRLEDSAQEAAHQPVLAGKRAAPGARPEARPAAGVQRGTHRGPREWPGLVVPRLRATGAPDLLRSELQATAAVVFAQALPGGVQPGTDESTSFAEWLCQQPGAGNVASA